MFIKGISRDSFLHVLSGLVAVILGLGLTVGAAAAQSGQARVVKGEKYIPGIWIDPDGCEHWVMDDGAEGYMDLKRDRQGLPTCHKANLCGVVNTDTLFHSDSARISAAGRERLHQFFQSAGAISYSIVGHTDSRASDEYNMRLSMRRANAVARVARETGARIANVTGYGERMPKASNATAAGRQENRRVEIMCWR